jgi:hypothetical protein
MNNSSNEIRRLLLRAAIALPLYPILPRARSEPVITVAVVAKIVMAVISGLQDLEKSRGDKALKTNIEIVLANIEAILQKQDIIIDELRKIQKLIVDNSLKSWKDAYSREINAFASALRVNLKDLYNSKNKGKLTTKLKQDFAWLANESAKVTNSAGALDPFTFYFYVTGVGVVFSCEEVLKASQSRVDGWKAEFVKPVNRWLDPQSPGSMPAILAQTITEIHDSKQRLAARPRQYTIATWESYDHESDEKICHNVYARIVTINGDYDSGFTWVDRVDKQSSICRATNNPTVGRGRYLIEPSGNAYADELNTERERIKNLELAESEQRWLIGQMEVLKKFLTSPTPRRT